MRVSQSCSTCCQQVHSPLKATPYYGSACLTVLFDPLPALTFTTQSHTILRQWVSHSLVRPISSTGIRHSRPHHTTAMGVSHSFVRLLASTGIRHSMLHYATAVRVSQSCQPAVGVFAGCADVDCYEIRADQDRDSSGSPPPPPPLHRQHHHVYLLHVPPGTQDHVTRCTCPILFLVLT